MAYAAGNIVDFVRGFGERKKDAKVERAIRDNYLSSPQDAIAEVFNIDTERGFALADKLRQQEAQKLAQTATQQAAREKRLEGAVRLMRGLPQGVKAAEALPGMAATFQGMGLDEQDMAVLNNMAAQGIDFSMLDDDAYKAMIEDKYNTTVATPGSHVMRGGNVINRVPFAPKTVTTAGGDGSRRTDIFDPNTMTWNPAPVEGDGVSELAPTQDVATPGLGQGPFTVEQLRPYFVAQESNDDYTAKNKETGALGRYQVMPDTGRNLAARLKLPWRPDLMTSDTQAARNYQDAIGNAAIQEAIDAGGGTDFDEITGYYYAGPDKKGWGPRTRTYQSDMRNRVFGERGSQPAPGGGGGGQAPIVTPPKPGKSFRAATPAELAAAGYPTGTAAQVDQDGKFVNIKTPGKGAKDAPKMANNAKQAIGQYDIMLGRVNTLIRHPGMKPGVGNVQGRLPGLVVGQDAVNFRNTLKTLQDMLGLTALQEAKLMSSQGASGFGNLSNAEGKRLEAIGNTLETTNDEATIQASLRELQTILTGKRSEAQRVLEEATPTPAVPIGTVIRKGDQRKVMTANGWEDVK